MKPHSKFRILGALAVLALVTLACIGQNGVKTPPTAVPPVQPTPDSQNTGPVTLSRSDLISATVQIYGLRSENGQLTPMYSGSGTIISPNGLILTNAHVASPAAQGEPDYEPDALAIGLMDQEDQPPVFQYFATVKAVDGYLDLAVIQVSTTMDGADVNPASLHLPYVPLGNSDDLHIGDHISIFGFPGIGGETITFTDGSVSGFTAEESVGDRAWIKTDATIAGGNSGGLAANDTGTIIGVPTIASSGAAGDITDCRVVQDTNGDGRLDTQDTCIPIGGFINGLRPVNLALPLIQAAQMGQAYASPYAGPDQPTSSGSGSESFSDVSWYSSSTDCDLGDPVNSYPSGTNAMAAAFSFNGMTDGEPWAEEWKVNGEVIYSSQYAWNLGDHGNTYTCLYNSQDGMPEGDYHLELYAGENLDLLTQSDVVVGGGGGGQTQPSGQGEVSVSGRIKDADSGNPIAGAEVYVLKPGMNFSDWKAGGFLESDLYSYAKSDSNGYYALPDRLSRDVGYTFVMYVEGYPINYADDLTWTDQDPSDFTLDLSMNH